MKHWVAGFLTVFVLMETAHAATELAFPSGGFEDPAGWTIGEEDGGMTTIVPEAARQGKMGLRVVDESGKAGSDGCKHKAGSTGKRCKDCKGKCGTGAAKPQRRETARQRSIREAIEKIKARRQK